LMNWWWLIAISVALGAGVGYFVRSKQPDVFYASTTVLFDQNIANGGQVSNFAAIQDLMDVQSGLVRRDKVLLPVIQELNLPLTVAQLNDKMDVRPVKDLPLLEILVGDSNPVTAANIANAVAREMILNSPSNTLNQDQAFRSQQLQDLATQINNLQGQYNDIVAKGSTLTSAFELAQNTDQQTKTLASLRELQKLYADMSAGLPDKTGLLTIFESASAETANRITGSLISVVLSGIGGLVLSVATILLISYFDDRLEWIDGMEAVQGIKVLGPLGLIPRSKLPLYVATMRDSIESEVLRQTRAKLVLAEGGNQPHIVTVTSYDSGDGKTVTAANLALTTAQTGLRTLLIDGDIRKGDAHQIFQLPNVMGLSDILASHEDLEVQLSQALLDSGYENLTVLPSGRSTADPAALVGGPRFPEMLDILSKQFEAIVMDSVPTIGGPDSAFMAENSNGVVIVIHAQRTTQKALARTLQTLRQGRNVKIYGLVFNRIALQVTSSYNQPYYRRTLSISPDKLSRELQTANSKGGLMSFNRNVIADEKGELLYSVAAASVQLGLTEAGLKNWIKGGHLKAEKRGMRFWIRQGEIDRLLNQLPRSPLQIPNKAAEPINLIDTNGQNSAMPDLLREQREALLDYAREPVIQEKKPRTTKRPTST
ncbi:MAG: polysaccharide biosynthesis tyrosine autokinase, partial [Chloroflexota bacterium]